MVLVGRVLRGKAGATAAVAARGGHGGERGEGAVVHRRVTGHLRRPPVPSQENKDADESDDIVEKQTFPSRRAGQT